VFFCAQKIGPQTAQITDTLPRKLKLPDIGAVISHKTQQQASQRDKTEET